MIALRSATTVFWDFDGVIKQSIESKTRAFVELFAGCAADVRERVREHHLANGGMSRFEKLPLYLSWAGVDASPAKIEEYCERFAALVVESVIAAEWVPGVESILRRNPYNQSFVLVTATPQDEIERILSALALRSSFAAVFGSPTSKSEAIRLTLAIRALQPGTCLTIGDARADFDAARANGVPFLLVKHATNERVFADYTGDSIRDFMAL